MNDAQKKMLSADDHLKALALFTMANKHYLESQRYEEALARLLGYKDSYLGHISDEMTGQSPDFEEALEKEGFVVDLNS